MRSIKVCLEDGTSYETSINGTNEQVRAYFVGNKLQFGDTEAHPADLLKTVVDVVFLDEETQDSPQI